MNFARLLDTLRNDEGFRSEPYQDTRGVWTIGYGATYIGRDHVSEQTLPVTEQEARRMLKVHIYDACIDAQGIFYNFNALGDVRQEVLVNMAFNLGRAGLIRFVKMIAALNRHNYVKAAIEMQDSSWAIQTGNRSKRLAHAMLTGEWTLNESN